MTVTENWDDDFEFNPNSPPRKKKNFNTNTTTNSTDGGQETRMSTTSSRFTVDWDADVDSPMNAAPPSHKAKVFTAPNLSDWAEPGPSTPSRRVPAGVGLGFVATGGRLTVPTENWDDDFEDKNDSTPVMRNRTRGERDAEPASPTKEITRNFRSMQPISKNDNSSTPGRNRASSSASAQYFNAVSKSKFSPSGDFADEEEEEEELGFVDKDEEDRTLTGRSSRRLGGRPNSLNSSNSSANTNHPLTLTPPPPVPSLPGHLTGGNPQPFPRSPSSSVFSLPTTIAGDSVHYGSTAYLQPIRTSSSGGGGSGGGGGGGKIFANLPPSPPIHRERERRRLRKKSRPQPQGVFELIPVESSLAALQEVERGEGYYGTSKERDRSPGRESARSGTSHSQSHSRPRTPQRPQTPQTPASATSPASIPHTSQAQVHGGNVNNLTATPSNKRHSGTSAPPPTPSSLLSRIGSVKKWGVRRKRGASISQNSPGSPGQEMGPPEDPGTLARPTSSLSSLPSTVSSHRTSSRPVSPPTQQQNPKSNWFFRNSDTFTTASGTSASVESTQSQPVGEGHPYAYAHHNYAYNRNYNHQYHSRGSKTDVRGGSTTDVRGSKTDIRAGSTADLGSLRPCSRDGNKDAAVVLSLGRKRSQTQVRIPSTSRSRRPSESAQANKEGNRTPSRSRTPGDGEEKETPSKLLKRKSLGFVQLRRTISSLGNGGDASDSSRGSSGSPSQPRHVSYGNTPLKGGGNAKGDVFQDRQNLDIPPPPAASDGRGRKKSLSMITKLRPKQDVPEGEREDKDEGKGFIRNVKISIVGRHRREKSATTSAAALAEVLPNSAAKPSLMSQPVAEDTTETKDIKPRRSQDTTPPIPVEVTPSSTLDPGLYALAEGDAEPDPQSLPQTPPRKISNATSIPTTPPASPKRATTPIKSPPSSLCPAVSPQTASLGRSTYSPTRNGASPDEKATPRRSSLGDLKIPARISQAQVGLRRDLGMVREFAQNVEQLKELQSTYHHLVVEIQELLDSHAHLHCAQQQVIARPVSPSFFSRPVGRKRSNTNPGPTNDPARQLAYKQLASAFYTINSKYRITWECAELLIELGGGTSSTPGPPGPTTSVSAPAVQANGEEGSSLTRRMGRERAVTLAGDESKPPSPMPGMMSPLETSNGLMASSSSAWRASTGRQELSQRQMILLKELLNNADSTFISEDVKPAIPEEPCPVVNKDWKWGDPSNSTVTLPPSESSGAPSSTPSTNAPNTKKRRSNRLGMAGLRDLLKMLKRHHTAHPTHAMPPFGSIPQSTSSLAISATNSSSADLSHPPPSNDLHEKAATYGRRRAKTSLGPETVSPTYSMYDSTPLPSRQWRGRPSLASIFRIPNSLKPNKVSGSHPAQQPDDAADEKRQKRNATDGSSSPAEEDWDQIDSVTDLDKPVKTGTIGKDGMATIRGNNGRSPYLQQPPPIPTSFLNGGRTSPRLAPRPMNASSSQTSLYEDSPTSSSHNVRPTRLSNVDENTVSSGPHGTSPNVTIAPLMPPPRMSSRYAALGVTNGKTSKNGSVRSMPPQPVPELRLAMTPENIKPLVENAKEVHGRLVECIAEIRLLLGSHKMVAIEPLQLTPSTEP